MVEADAALEEFRTNSGFGEALDALKDNPLPHALVVRPAAEFREPTQVVSLTTELRGLEGVDIVQLDTAWVSRFNAILDVVRRGVLLAVGLFALGVLVIVGNTIRLDIENRRDEIEVTKLVGGSDAFVRRPFLYNGVWYGLGGGLIAWLVVTVVIAVLGDPVQRIAGLYGSSFELRGPRTRGQRSPCSWAGSRSAGSARSSRPPGICGASSRSRKRTRWVKRPADRVCGGAEATCRWRWSSTAHPVVGLLQPIMNLFYFNTYGIPARPPGVNFPTS